MGKLALGGNVFGWLTDERQSFDVLDAYVASGGDWIDTADFYAAFAPGCAGGESESMLGRWLARGGNRDRVVIATKVGWKPDRRGLSAVNIAAAVDDSLARLRTDRIDMYYAHADDPTVPLAESLGAFAQLIQDGKVREIAASNYSADRLRAALEVSAQHGLPRFVALQTLYNAAERAQYESEFAPILPELGVSGLAYSSLAKGFLTGAVTSSDFADEDQSLVARTIRRLSTEARGTLAAVVDIADGRGVAPAAVAIAWLLAQPTVGAATAAVTTVDQLEAMLPGTSMTLTDDELAAVASAHDDRC